MSPEFRLRPSLSVKARAEKSAREAGVAGVQTPAFVERRSHPSGRLPVPAIGRVAGVQTPAFAERRMQGGATSTPGHDGGSGILRRRRVWIVGLRLGLEERLGADRWRSPRPSTCALKGPVIFPWPPETPHSKIPRRPEPPHAWHVRGPLMTAPAYKRRSGTASPSILRTGTSRTEHLHWER